MRTIKFRCWFADKMYYAIPAIWFTREGVKVVNLNHDHEDFTQSYDTWTGQDDYHLMQFTGLHDKNRKKIYEGDIVNLHPDENDKMWHRQIVWDTAAFHCKQIHGDANHPLHFHKHMPNAEWVVIGNIHENPDLL